ncbi:ATP-binding protein [Variovorax gossypii]|nr:ATP-binding protein [Variovorax gossypii]
MSTSEYTGPLTPEVLRVGEQVLNVVVDHAVFRRIREASMEMVHIMRSLKLPHGILVQADSGMGKSLLIELIRRELAPQALPNGANACLHMALDSTVDANGIAAAMTRALGYPALPARRQLESMNHMTQAALERTRPLALLIDEMQHVCEGNKDITARSVTDWLKVRMDRHNFPVICLGTHALERLAVINPQFTGRASASFVIQPFKFDESWRQVVAGFSSAVNSVDLSIANGAACRPLHQASVGNMRMLKRILTYACMYASTQPNRVVDMASLSSAFIDAKGQVAEQMNPFRSGRREAT